MLAISILPVLGAGLLLADSALASPVVPTARSLELSGSPIKEAFPNGFDAELRKRECAYIQKYARRAEHELAIAGRRRPRQAKQGVATVALTDVGANAYVGALSIGTPAQAFPVIFDTGSADLWMSTKCSKDCPVGYFHSNESSTFRNTSAPAGIVFPTASVQGYVAKDTVSVAGITVPDQTFLAVEASTFGPGVPFAGLMGLSFSSMSFLQQPTFLDNLIAQHKLSRNLFGVHLGSKTTRSALTLGAVDTTKYTGELTELQVATSTYWDLTSSGYFVGDAPAYRVQVRAAIDTGSSVSYLPSAGAAAVYKKIEGSTVENAVIPALGSNYNVQFYSFPCANAQEVGFSFKGSSKVFKQTADALIGLNYGNGTCAGSINGVDIRDPITGSKISILGVPFLRSYYSIFNRDGQSGPTISFATAA